MINITLISGPAGSSKSTLATLVQDFIAANPSSLVALDSSRCLENSRNRRTPSGIILSGLEIEQKKGVILPGKPVVHSILENIEWLKPTPLHVLIAGCPRSDEERREWMALRKSGALSFRVLNIQCNYEEMVAGINDRILKGFIRHDGEKEIQTRWKEYQEKALPILDRIPQNLLFTTQRAQPLVKRTEDLVNCMDIPENVRIKWLRRLHERSHPIHSRIREIEGLATKTPIQFPRENQRAKQNTHPQEFAAMTA